MSCSKQKYHTYCNCNFWMIRVQNSRAAELLEIAQTVSTLVDDLKQEKIELVQRQITFLPFATQVVKALYLHRFSPHEQTFSEVNDRYDAVGIRVNALKMEITECYQNHMAQVAALSSFMKTPPSRDILAKMTIEDHLAKLKEVDEAKKKAIEVQTGVEKVRAEWNGIRESVNRELVDCIQRIHALLRLIQTEQGADHDARGI